MGRQASRRFVAAMTVDEAIAVAERLNAEGIEATLDSLGESVMQVSQAEESGAIYHQLLDAIAAKHLRANVSVKLTQVGMDIGGHGAGPSLAERIVGEMVEHAAEADTFVRIDMEGSDYTEATIVMTERLHARWPGRVGTVLQAYLFRSEAVGELRQQYGRHFAEGYGDQDPIGEVLGRAGVTTLDEYLAQHHKASR